MRHNEDDASWVVIPRPVPNAKLRLFCLPFAGGGSTSFRHWPELLPPYIELAAIEIPGRGSRLSEPCQRRINILVSQITKGIQPYLDKPYAFFGHSMGALLSFEISHTIREQLNQEPNLLFISGRGAPHMHSREKPIHVLPDDEFVEEIKKYNGTPKEVLEHEDLMDILTPILKADFEVCETYTYSEKQPLNCPITAFGGLQDASTSREQLQAWQDYTNGLFNLRMFMGDHFYLINTASELIHAITKDLAAHANVLI